MVISTNFIENCVFVFLEVRILNQILPKEKQQQQL